MKKLIPCILFFSLQPAAHAGGWTPLRFTYANPATETLHAFPNKPNVYGLDVGIGISSARWVVGAQVSLFGSDSRNLAGLQIVPFNGAERLFGAQLGIANILIPLDKQSLMFGAQLGIFNRMDGKGRGLLQAGAWNTGEGLLSGIQIGVVNLGLRKTYQGGREIRDGKKLPLDPNKFKIRELDISGLQAGLLYNSARHVRGLQIGLLNRCNSLKGMQIGILNIVASRSSLRMIPFINVGWQSAS